jgi:hypothetical protein
MKLFHLNKFYAYSGFFWIGFTLTFSKNIANSLDKLIINLNNEKHHSNVT